MAGAGPNRAERRSPAVQLRTLESFKCEVSAASALSPVEALRYE